MSGAPKRDFYQVLEVDRAASAEEIKRAYRKLAVRFHPDRNQNDAEAEEAFKEVSEAYAVLCDPEKRARYDRIGHEAFQSKASRSRYEQVDLGSIGEMFEELIGEVFVRKDGSRRIPRDVNYDLYITFEEAALGTEKVIAFDREQPCERCGGSRAEPGAKTETCPSCKGKGEVKRTSGFFASHAVCAECAGSGIKTDRPCTACDGKGSLMQKQSLNVRIPAGVEDGALRTIKGEGERTLAGAGNLHLKVHVKEHALFKRAGADILCEVPVSFPQAALSCQIDIPTLEGKVKMKIPAGTQSGRVFRLRGKGLPVFGGYGKGDQLVKVMVEVPEALSPRQRELLQLLEQELGAEAHPKQKGFLEKLKELFD